MSGLPRVSRVNPIECRCPAILQSHINPVISDGDHSLLVKNRTLNSFTVLKVAPNSVGSIADQAV